MWKYQFTIRVHVQTCHILHLPLPKKTQKGELQETSMLQLHCVPLGFLSNFFGCLLVRRNCKWRQNASEKHCMVSLQKKRKQLTQLQIRRVFWTKGIWFSKSYHVYRHFSLNFLYLIVKVLAAKLWKSLWCLFNTHFSLHSIMLLNFKSNIRMNHF